MPEISDAELVARLKNREGEAVGVLVKQYADRLYNYAYYRCNNHHTAEDVVSETFVRVIEKIHGYEQREIPFRAWVFRIAHNLLVNHFRQSKRHNLVSLDKLDWSMETAGGMAGNLDLADKKDLVSQISDRDALKQAIDALPEDQQAVFVMRFIEELELEQVALMMDRSVVSIKSLQYRAVKNLRKMLNRSRGVEVIE